MLDTLQSVANGVTMYNITSSTAEAQAWRVPDGRCLHAPEPRRDRFWPTATRHPDRSTGAEIDDLDRKALR